MTVIPPNRPGLQLPPFSPAKADDMPGGASFATVFDQMLGSGEPAGQIDAGDERVAHFTGAEMFDEDGLFRGAVWGGPAHMPKAGLLSGPAAPSDAAPPPVTTTDVAVIPTQTNGSVPPIAASPQILPRDDTGPVQATAGNAPDAPPAATTGSPSVSRAVDMLVVPSVDSPGMPEQPITASLPLAPATGGRLATRFASNVARPAQPPRAQGSATETQVIARTSAQGMHVAARLDQTSRTERLRLRDRIMALLARHGFALDAVRIDAASRSYPHSREEE